MLRPVLWPAPNVATHSEVWRCLTNLTGLSPEKIEACRKRNKISPRCGWVGTRPGPLSRRVVHPETGHNRAVVGCHAPVRQGQRPAFLRNPLPGHRLADEDVVDSAV